MANTYLTRTCTAGNRRKWTWSAWIKRTSTGTEENILTGYEASTTYTELKFNNVDQLQFQNRISNTWSGELKTNRKFIDVNSWYHIVIVWDSENTNSAAQRMRMYINGVEESSFATRQNPSNPTDSSVNWVGRPLRYGSWQGSNRYFDGLMSHVHFIDGTVYTPSAFGETDATTGEWKIKTSVSVTYGTNGSFILKDGNSVTDQSGQTNNFTVGGGTLTKTEDNPSNVFCTMNSLDANASMAFANGNTTTVSPENNYMPCKATIAMFGQNGKFYWEGKCLSGSAHYFGVYDASGAVRGQVQGDMDSNRFVYTYQGGIERTITGQSAIGGGTYATIANGDIIGVGLDKENGTITFWKNGTQIYTETHSSLQTKNLIPGTQAYGSDINWNFGNGYFGTTAISSAGTNASNNGIFEYNVPAGFTALSTKGLNL